FPGTLWLARLVFTNQPGLITIYEPSDYGASGSPTPTPTPQALVSFTLVNADNGQDISTLNNGATINLASSPTQHLNIRANTNPSTVGSVTMVLSGTQSQTQTENTAPYALFGDNGAGVYNSWT